MAQKRFNTTTEIALNEGTLSVNIIPEVGVTFNVSYWTGFAWFPDDSNPQSGAVNAAVQCTKIKVEPIGGHVAVVGKGDF